MDTPEIIRQLEGDPALRAQLRAILLGDELPALPDVVRQLASQMQQLTQRVDQLTQRVDQLTQRVEQLTQRVDQFVISADRRFGTIEQDLAEVKGRFLEHALATAPRRYVPRSLARMVTPATGERLEELLGLLDDAGGADVERADAILDARLPDGDPVVIVVEAAWVAHSDDIERAARRAVLLAGRDVPTKALVVSHSRPADVVLALARERGVAVVTESDGLVELAT